MKSISRITLLRSALVLCAGSGIAWVDTRPGWDDTGITVGLLIIAAAVGSLAGVRPLIAASLAAVPMLIAELPRGTGVLLAIPVALAGAFAGALIRRIVRPGR
jgi:hypothetical protein